MKDDIDQPETTTDEIEEGVYDDDEMWDEFQSHLKSAEDDVQEDDESEPEEEIGVEFAENEPKGESVGTSGEYEPHADAERDKARKVDTNTVARVAANHGSWAAGDEGGHYGGGVPSGIAPDKAMWNSLWAIDGYIIRAYGRTAITSHKVRGQAEEIEQYTKDWVHKSGERNFDVKLNKKKTQPETHREELVSEFGEQEAEWREVRNYVAGEVKAFVESELESAVGGEDNLERAVNQLKAQVQSKTVSDAMIKFRLATYLMEPVELPERMAEFATPLGFGAKSGPEHYAGTGDPTNVPEDFEGKMSPALRRKRDVLGAGERVIDDLQLECPGPFEKVTDPEYQSVASVCGEVVNIFDPRAGNQKQVFMLKDSDNEIVKVTVWNESDVEKFGDIDCMGMGALDYTDAQDVPVVSKGDKVEIHHASPGTHRGDLTLAVTEQSMVVITEKGGGESPVSLGKTGSIGRLQDLGGSSEAKSRHDYENNHPSDFDSSDFEGGAPVPVPRLRNRRVTLAREGRFCDAETIGIGNAAFHSEVAYDGSFNRGSPETDHLLASDEEGTPDMSSYDGPTVFVRSQMGEVELPLNAEDLDEVESTGVEPVETELNRPERISDMLRNTESEEEAVGEECPECGNQRLVNSKQMQMGGADEGMTGKHSCGNCGNRWTTGY